MAKKLPHPNIVDITGKTFFGLTATNYVKTNRGRSAVWNFVCLCGNEVEATFSSVRRGARKTCGCGRRLPDNLAAIRRAMSGYVFRSKTLNREFTLTFDQFKEITQQKCTYCGVLSAHKSKSRTGVYHYNGIDRKDNSIGYTYENSLPCCAICNSVKGQYLSVDEMKELMKNKVEKAKGEDPWKDFRNVG